MLFFVQYPVSILLATNQHSLVVYDLIIRGGEVIDGSRGSRKRADVAIRADRITELGDLADAQAKQEIDARGSVVAPGFIDVHNHSDGWLLKYPHLMPKLQQGFTTEVIMADGISYAPVNQHTAAEWMYYLRSLNGLQMTDYDGWQSLPDYLAKLDGQTAQNVAFHVPYANVRTLACGFDRRPVDDFEMRQIQAEIQLGMESGAVGLSTGLDYISECFSTTSELAEACRTLRDYQGLYVTHIRYKKQLLPALREAVEICQQAEIPLHVSHLKWQPPYAVDEVLRFFDWISSQVDFSYDVYPYQPGSTMLNYLLPYEVWEDGPLAVTAKLQQADIRARFAQGLASYRLDMHHIRIAWLPSRANAPHIGKTLAEYVAQTGLAAADAIFNLLVEEGLAVLCVFDEGDDRLVHPFLQHERCMIGSDGIFFPDGQVHPRMYGTAGRMLGPLVRNDQLFSLPDAVYKLSTFPAQRFGLQDRGFIREGAFADLVIFNADEVSDQATYDHPDQPAVGISHVLVNGAVVLEHGNPRTGPNNALPGRVLKYTQP